MLNSNSLNYTYTNKDYYDITAEQESLDVLKTQNKKIKQLFEELSKRETSISSLKDQVNSYLRSHKDFEAERGNFAQREKIFKDQIGLLESQNHQLEISDREKDKIIKSNIEKFQRRESELIKVIEEKDDLIDLTNCENEKTKKQLCDKNDELSLITNQMLDYKEKYEISNKEKDLLIREINRLKEEASQSKKASLEDETKISQLVEVIQTQAKELQELSDSLDEQFERNKKLKSENNKLISDNQEKELKLDELNSKLDSLRFYEQGYKEKDKEANDLKVNLKNEKEKYSNLLAKIENIEQETHNVHNLIENKESAQVSLSHKNLELEKSKHELMIKVNKLEAELENKSLGEVDLTEDIRLFVEIISKDILLAMNFIDTYLGNTCYQLSNQEQTQNQNQNQTEYEYEERKFINKQLFDIDYVSQLNKKITSLFKHRLFEEYLTKCNLHNLFDSLVKVQKRIKEELTEVEETNRSLISENLSLLEKLNKSKSENSDLKSEIITHIESITAIESEKEALREEIASLKNNNSEYIDKIRSKLHRGLLCFKDLEEDMKEVINSIESLKGNLNKHFIDLDDLREIFKFNFKDQKEVEFDYESFKENLRTFFGLLRNLCEEFNISTIKLNELNCLKTEIEQINADFLKNKSMLSKENNELKDKIYNLERLYEDECNRNTILLQQEYKEKQDQLARTLLDKESENENLKNEVMLMKDQLESYDKRLSVFLSNKAHQDHALSNEVDLLKRKLEKLNSHNIELLNENDCMKVTLQEKDKIINKLKHNI